VLQGRPLERDQSLKHKNNALTQGTTEGGWKSGTLETYLKKRRGEGSKEYLFSAPGDNVVAKEAGKLNMEI